MDFIFSYCKLHSWTGRWKKLRKYFFSYFGKPKAGLVVYQPIQKPKFQKHKNLVVWFPILGELTPEHKSYELCTFLLRCSNQGLIGWRIWNNEKIEIVKRDEQNKSSLKRPSWLQFNQISLDFGAVHSFLTTTLFLRELCFKIHKENFGNIKIRTRGCWVSSYNITFVLCLNVKLAVKKPFYH